jgi:hypothetical protein
MKPFDTDREQSERIRTMDDFLASYNQNLPTAFPRASKELLQEFKKINADLFKTGNNWSLNLHRKKVMDWLPAHSG